MNDKTKFQDDDFVGRWISQDLSDAEALEFEQWIAANPEEKKTFDELKSTWEAYGKIKLKQGLSKEERWQQISDRVYLTPESRSEKKPLTARLISFAAAAAILIGLVSYWNISKLESIVAPRGSKITSTFPDGSEVNLNAESSLKYNPKKWLEKREVILAGEAFFKVETVGTPFLVKTDLSTTEVLGTTFNVKARRQIVEVACVTGKVTVKSNQKTGDSVILNPGFASMILANKKPSAPYQFDIDQVTGWIKGEINFRSTPLNHVFEEIARQFNLEIEVQADIAGLTFTGRFTDSDLNKALEAVCLSSGLKYQVTGESTIIITD